jgi:hypothetical protein
MSRRAASRFRPHLHPTLVALLVLVALTIALLAAKAEQITLGAQAYIFGFPLVIMDVTRASQGATGARENQLQRVRRFPDADFRGVVRPNVDTLYTNAFIDMAQGPWVFELPANDQRYTVMPFMDAWTNVFASPGTRSTGNGAGRFLLAGPGWHGVVPPGMALLRAPTRLVWLIGRTQTRGSADYPVVHRLQDGITLRRLADAAGNGNGNATPDTSVAAPAMNGASPLAQVAAMPTQVFFDRLANLMVDNPPNAADASMLTRLQRLGIAPGRKPQWGLADRWAVALGRAVANWTVARELGRRPHRGGWITPPAILGNYGTAYNIRAVVAMVGLGANLPEDAIYPNAAIDSDGEPLDGSRRYRLRFAKGALPPVNAFWSVTAYGPDAFFIDNPLGRHALGSSDRLTTHPDGSLELLVQAQAPLAGSSNWLPVQAGAPFQLTMRLYWPRTDALDGSWTPPAIVRVD